MQNVYQYKSVDRTVPLPPNRAALSHDEFAPSHAMSLPFNLIQTQQQEPSLNGRDVFYWQLPHQNLSS